MRGLFFKKDERQRWGYGFFGAAGVAVALIQAKIAQALVAGEQFQPWRGTVFFPVLGADRSRGRFLDVLDVPSVFRSAAYLPAKYPERTPQSSLSHQPPSRRCRF